MKRGSKQKNIPFLCKACRKASDWQRKRKVDGGVGAVVSGYHFFCGFEYFFHWEFGRGRRHEEFRNLVIFIQFFFSFPEIHILLLFLKHIGLNSYIY